MNAVKQADVGVGLHLHEANWARRLRVPLAGLHPFAQYRMIFSYSVREQICYYLQQDLWRWTPDLDGFLAYKPWLPGERNCLAYEIALAAGVVPKLRLDVFNLLSDLPLPEPESLEEEVRLSWTPQFHWLLRPWGTLIPGLENDPDRATMLGQLLKFWAGAKATDVSTQEEGEEDNG
jgi:hypothetical protein